MSGNTHESSKDSESRIVSESLVIMFIFLVMIIGGFVRLISKKLHIPFTPTIFFIGIVFTFISNNFGGILKESVFKISNIDPHGLLQIFLPILVFDSAFSLDWHVFRKEIKQILILAYPCVLLNAILMMLSIKLVLFYDDSKYTWLSALMFGSIISCTDPVAVTAILKEMGCSKRFSTLLEGESLLNDATGLIFYQISVTLFKGQGASFGTLLFDFLSLSIGGVLFGLIVGVFSSLFIQKLYNDEILIVNTTLFSGYVAYFLAEGCTIYLGIQVSPIFAVISYGLFMSAVGKTKINPASDHAVHTFWSYLVYASETAIFFLAGLIVGVKMQYQGDYINASDYYRLGLLYICLNVVRLIVLLVHYPILKNHGYGINLAEVYCLAYGGLRGAVGISFAMIVSHDIELAQDFRDLFFFDAAGCTILTLIINATTTELFINKSGAILKNPIKEQVFIGFLKMLLEEVNKKTDELKSNKYFHVADWEKVNEVSGTYVLHRMIYESEKKTKENHSFNRLEEDEQKTSLISNKLKNTMLEIEMRALPNLDPLLLSEARDRYITLLKGLYYEFFKTNQCSGDAFLVLNASANWDLDKTTDPMNSWEYISNTFYKPQYVTAFMNLQHVKCFGNLIKKTIFNHITHSYDIVSVYVEVQKKACCIAKKFPIKETYLRQIIAEAENNKSKGENYIYIYLEAHFPEIIRSIQTKRAAFTILEYKRSRVQEDYEMGQIDDKEFKILEGKINESLINLSSFNPEWIPVSLKKILQSIPFFAYIAQNTIDQLCEEAIQKSAEKDKPLTKEGEKCLYLYIIIRGSGTEFSYLDGSSYNEKMGVGSIISFHHLVSSKPNYITTFLPDPLLNYAALKIETVKSLTEKNIDLEAYAWRESLYALSKIYFENLKPLGTLEKSDFFKLLSFTAFHKKLMGEIIDLKDGGILLQGILCIYEEEKHSSLIEQLNSSAKLRKNQELEINDSNRNSFKERIKSKGTRELQNPIFFEPNHLTYTYLALEDIVYFEFVSTDALKEIFAKESFIYEKFSHISASRKDIVGSLANIMNGASTSMKSIGYES